MENDPRTIELLSDMLVEQRITNEKLGKLEMSTNLRLERLENRQARTNAAIGELRLSVMKLADKF
jgi:uncharacterized coiled-coil protein SlyX